MAPLLIGALRAMADDYGALAILELAGIEGGVERLRIRVFDADFNEGKAFSLGPACRNECVGRFRLDARDPSDAASSTGFCRCMCGLGPTGRSGTRAPRCRRWPAGQSFPDFAQRTSSISAVPAASTSLNVFSRGEGERLALVLTGGGGRAPARRARPVA
jgi:hypothetical protein